jgi:hypothetical protein
MSEKVVPTIGLVPEKKGVTVGVYRDTLEKKTRKTRQPVTVESLLANIWALRALLPNGEDVPTEQHPVLSLRQFISDDECPYVVTVTMGDRDPNYIKVSASTLKGALQDVVAHLQEEVEEERRRLTEEIDSVLRAHGAKRRKTT